MQITSNDFFFDKTELFTKLKKVETILGITGDVINLGTVDQRLQTLQTSLANVITNYTSKTYVDNKLLEKVSKTGDSILANIQLLATPSAANHLIHKAYVDDLLTITDGNITNLENLITTIQNTYTTKTYVDNEVAVVQVEINSLESSVNTLMTDPVTKAYVDSATASKLSLGGGSMSGALVLAADPVTDSQAVTKRYVDLIAAGIKTKPAVNLMSLVNVPGVLVNNVLTATMNGVLNVDGKNAEPNYKILLGNQLDYRENGCYSVVNPGTDTTPYVLERTELSNSSDEIPGSYFFVTGGVELKATGWILVVNDPDTFTLNTDLIYVIQFSGRSLYIAGNGLNLIGNTFHINTENAGRIVVNSDSIDLALTGVSSGTYTKLTVDSYGRVTSAAQLVASDIPTLSWNKIALDRPTTVDGYGITDAVKKTGDTMTGVLTLSNDPSANLHAATKQYVDGKFNALTNTVTSGDTNLQAQINAAIVEIDALQVDPVTKSYVDTQDSAKLNLTGGTMTGPIVLSGLPTAGNQAASKQYIDNSISVLNDAISNGDASLQAQITDVVQDVAVLRTDPVTKTYVDNQDALKLNKAGDSMSGALSLNGNPTANLHAVPKQYVDSAVTTLTSGKLDKAGGTMTGTLVLASDPSAPLQPATKQYVDGIQSTLQGNLNAAVNTLQSEVTTLQTDVTALKADPVTKAYVDSNDATKINRNGDTLTTALQLDYTPVNDKDAVNKLYVDNFAAGVKPRLSVKYATTVNIDGSYSNGTGGIGATFTGLVVGQLIVDGHAAELNERILLKNQTNKIQNGVFRLTNNGQSAAFVLIRENNYNESVEIPGSEFYVEAGNTLARTNWIALVDNPDTFVLGTDTISFTQSGAIASGYTAGSGLILNGYSFQVNLDTNSGLSLGNQKLSVLIKDSTILKDGSGIYLNPSFQTSLNDKVSISGNTTVTGNIIIGAGGSLKSNATASATNDVVTKGYVDSAITPIQTNVSALQSTVTTLNTDPVTKTYVNTQDALKLNLTGGTLTGFLTLNASPTANLHAATKQYVDSAITNLTTYVDNQVATRLSLSGGTLTGQLVLASDPTVNMNAATKQYVDGAVGNAQATLDAKDTLLQTQINSVQSTVNALNTDPVTKTYVDTQNSTKLSYAGGVMTGFLTLSGAPTANLHAATKQYVDSGLSAINAANITIGTLPSGRLPAFTGDATSTAGSTALTLSNTGVTAGTYTKVTTDAKGRITAGATLTFSDIPNLDWTKITTGKPTTLSGYGITDGLNKAGDTMTGLLVLSGNPVANLNPATKQYVDVGLADKISSQGDTMTGALTLSGDPTAALHAATKNYVDVEINKTVPTGTVIISSQNDVPSGFLRCNGALVPSATYPELCQSLSDKTNIANFGSGKHWRQQYLISKNSSLSSLTFTTNTNLPANLNNHRVCVINNDNALIIGGNTAAGSGYVNTVYLIGADSSGILRSYTALSESFPIAIANHEVIVYGSYIYVIGGTSNGTTPLTSVYRTQFNINEKSTTGWELISTMPTALFNHTCFLFNNRLYVLGGNTSSTVMTDNIICADIREDGSLGAWVFAGKLPQVYKDFAVAITKNKVYLIGGNTSASAVTSISNVYSTNFTFTKWNTEASLPTAFSQGSCVVIRDMLYIIGCYTTVAVRNIYYAYIDEEGDIGSYVLSSIQTPSAVSNMELAVIGNKLHACGGLRSSGAHANFSYYTDFLTTSINYNYSYNEVYNSVGFGAPDQFQSEFNYNSNAGLNFSAYATLPVAMYNLSTFVTNNYVYVVAGATTLANANSINVYRYPINADGTLGSSTTINGPTNLTMTGAILCNKTIYLIGGYNGTSALNTIYKSTIASDGTLGVWTSMTNLPISVYNHSVILIKNRIYILGGNLSSGVNNTIYMATLITNTNFSSWVGVSNLPDDIVNFKPLFLNDRLYLFGGRVNGTPINKVYYCSVNNDGSIGAWNEYISLPTALANFLLVTSFDTVFLIGGTGLSNNVSTIYKATINVDNTLSGWTNIGTLPIALSNSAVSIVKNKMYLFGGYNGTALVNNIYQADYIGGKNNYISNNIPLYYNNIQSSNIHKDQFQFNTSGVFSLYSFTNEQTLPAALYASKVIVTNGNLFVVGGNNGTAPVTTIYRATITAGKIGTFSTNGVALPAALMKHMTAVIGDKLYVFGGITTGTTSKNIVYINSLLNSGLITNAFTTGTALPTALDSGEVVVTSSRVYIMGGNTNNVASNLVYSAPINSDNTLGAWVAESNLPVALRDFKAVILKDYVYLFGGKTTAVVNTVYRARYYNDGTIGTFSLYGYLPTPVSCFELVTVNSRLFIVGGNTTGDVATQNTYIVPIQSTGILGTGLDGSNNITGITLNPTLLPNNVSYASMAITSNTLYLIGGFNSGALSAAYGSVFSGGRDNYLNNPFNFNPLKFKLPEFNNTGLDISGYSVYIKT